MRREPQYSEQMQLLAYQQQAEAILRMESNSKGLPKLLQLAERQLVGGEHELLRRELRLCLHRLHPRETEQVEKGLARGQRLMEEGLTLLVEIAIGINNYSTINPIIAYPIGKQSTITSML
jgi:hypothetical protein